MNFGPRCRFTHDIPAYLAAKPRDIRMPPASSISNVPPFIIDPSPSQLPPPPSPSSPSTPATFSSLDSTTTCPLFAESGECRLGLKCRFLGAHAHSSIDPETGSGTVTLLVDEEKKSSVAGAHVELNQIGAEALKLLRQKKVSLCFLDCFT